MRTHKNIYLIITIAVFIVFAVWKNVTNIQLKREKASYKNSTQQIKSALVTINLSTPRNQKDFDAIKTGMRLPELKKALRIKEFNVKVGHYLSYKHVVFKFSSPDGSSFDVLFRHGRVQGKRKVSIAQNSAGFNSFPLEKYESDDSSF